MPAEESGARAVDAVVFYGPVTTTEAVLRVEQRLERVAESLNDIYGVLLTIADHLASRVAQEGRR